MSVARRRLARFVVLVVAGLAVAGTSASPPPPPLATARASGILDVTTARPLASVIVTLAASEAAMAVAGSRIVSQIDAGPGPGSASPGPVVVIIEALDTAAGDRALGDTAHLFGSIVAGSGRYRVTAVLIDPAVKTASVGWHASAELRVDRPDRPSTAPAGATLDARAGDPQTRPARELALARVPAETVSLDADHPRATRMLLLDQPAGPPGVSALATWLAFLDVADPTGTRTSQPVVARLAIPGELGPLTNGQLGRGAFFPTECAVAGPCATTLRLDLATPGGTVDDAHDVTWSAFVLGFGSSGDASPAPMGLRVTSASDVGPTTPSLRQTASGSFNVRKGANASRVATVTVDAGTVAQADGPVRGALQMRFEARPAATPGSASINVGVGSFRDDRSLPSVYGKVAPGQVTTLVTAVVAIDCAGRSRCSFEVPYFASASDDGPVVAVDWVLSATFFSDGPVPDELALTLTTAAASAAP